MNHKDRLYMIELADEVGSARRKLMRLSHHLGGGKSVAAEVYPDLFVVLERYLAAADEIKAIAEKLLGNDFDVIEPTDFTENEAQRLRNLSHAMCTVSRFMHGTADKIRPVMQARVADGGDPIFDYEIQAKIDYELREDDPEYNENIDNYLSSRSEILTHEREVEELNEDWRNSFTLEPFRDQPLSWLLHSLIEHRYGSEGPRVDARSCLRIGKVFMDIQVWHQYAFDITEGKWVKRLQPPEGISEYLELTAPMG